MSYHALRDPWFVGFSLVIGVFLLLLWAWLGELFFEGNARSLLGVNALVFVMALVLIAGVVTWRRLPRRAIVVGGALAAASFLVAMVAGMAFVASQEGHCGPSTTLHAQWHEPGVWNATREGVPGTTTGARVDEGVWSSSVFEIDGKPVTLSVRNDDSVVAWSPNMDWDAWSGDINRTLGAVLPLTYSGLSMEPRTSVC